MIAAVVHAGYAPMMLNTAEIKRRRIARKLSMDEAAEQSQIGGRQNWYRIESGRRKNVTSDTLGRIAKVLRCKVDAILAR